MENYSINSSINKSISSKGTSTKTRTSNDSAEESGWTAYFEDYDQQNSHCSSSFSCSVSLVSDVATTVAGAVAGACSSTCDTSLKVPMKLGFKKTRTKEICGGDSLEDTATSPVNSPKVRDVKSNNMDPKQREDQIHSSLGKDTTSENYSKRGCSFDHGFNKRGENMEHGPSGGSTAMRRRSGVRGGTRMEWLEHDILCIIFSFLDVFDLVRCTAVCKSWNAVIRKSELLQVLYFKLRRDSGESTSSGQRKSMEFGLQEVAMKYHRLCLQRGRIDIHQWKAHSVGVDQCRMKMGLLLTGVGDKVMRLWSLDSYKCEEEYYIPDTAFLVDFDFDESKIVGLLGSRVGIWTRNGKRSIFPSREGTFSKGLCVRYIDPDAVIGCEDGTARVFDMYSRTCSRIIKMHAGPVTCLALSDDELILSGSSLGSVSISDLASDQRVARLRSTDSAGIRTLCFNPCSHLVFAGTTVGYTYCWDLRTMKSLWETRISSNVLYSLSYLRSDNSTLAVGGIDGVLRVLNQNTGEVLSRCLIDDERPISSTRNMHAFIEKKKGIRLPEDAEVDRIPRTCRPPITCLSVGMKKVVTAHNSKYIRMWKFKM